MKILILGGTRFVGRHIAEAALRRGHAVTLLHRGRTAPAGLPRCESIVGDRRGELTELAGRQFDACIDTSGYLPSIVARNVATLNGRLGHVTFVSTLSVYADVDGKGPTEGADVARLEANAAEEVTPASYGALKAACEEAWRANSDAPLSVVRAGLVVGRHDDSDRFTYWAHRISDGGEVLCPGPELQRVQFIDARDLASFVLDGAERKLSGTFNATGPEREMTLVELFELCASRTDSHARFTWVDPSFLLEHDVQPWVELPLWLPEENGRGLLTTDTSKARANGLVTRPVTETLDDVLSWLSEWSSGRELRAGLTRMRERELLDLWHAESHASQRVVVGGREI